MRVLLTGGNGFLGKHLQSALQTSGIEYILYDRNYWGSLEQASHFQRFIEWSPTVDCIIHLAAKVGGIGANNESPYDFMYSNLAMGINVIEVAKSINAKVIMASTVCGYPSNPSTIPFIEDELWCGYPEKTNAPYGIAKRTLTELLWSANKQYDLRSVTLNLANMYGSGDSDNLDTSHVIPALIKKIKYAKENNKTVELWGDGTPSRDFLHVEDAVQAIILALNLSQGPQFGINIGTGVETSIFEIAYMISTILEYSPHNIIWDNSKPNGQQRRCLNSSVAKNLLGWSAKKTLYKGIKELCNLKT